MRRRAERVYRWSGYAAFAIVTVLMWCNWITRPAYLITATLTLIYPVYQYLGPDRRRLTTLLRRRDRYCRTCGFDVRETPMRCPECGKRLRLDRPGA